MCVIRSVSDPRRSSGATVRLPRLPLDRFVSSPTACPSPPRAAPDSSSTITSSRSNAWSMRAFAFSTASPARITLLVAISSTRSCRSKSRGSEPAEVRQHALAVVLDRDVGLRHVQLHLHDGAVGGRRGDDRGFRGRSRLHLRLRRLRGGGRLRDGGGGGGGERGVRFVREGEAAGRTARERRRRWWWRDAEISRAPRAPPRVR